MHSYLWIECESVFGNILQARSFLSSAAVCLLGVVAKPFNSPMNSVREIAPVDTESHWHGSQCVSVWSPEVFAWQLSRSPLGVLRPAPVLKWPARPCCCPAASWVPAESPPHWARGPRSSHLRTSPSAPHWERCQPSDRGLWHLGLMKGTLPWGTSERCPVRSLLYFLSLSWQSRLIENWRWDSKGISKLLSSACFWNIFPTKKMDSLKTRKHLLRRHSSF